MKKPTVKIYIEDLLIILHGQFGQAGAAQAINEIIAKSNSSRDILKHRISLEPGTRAKAKAVKKSTEIDSENINLFNRTLVSLRNLRHHVGVRLCEENTAEYKHLLGIVELAEQYSREMFEGNRIEAYKSYITIGLDLMQKTYGLNRFKFFNQAIFNTRVNELLVAQDDQPILTRYMTEAYKHQVKKATNTDCIIVAADLVNFIYARKDAEHYKLDYKHWIKAQFTQLEFINAVPKPSQLHGEKALSRYRDHIVKVGKDDGVIREGWTNAQWIEYIQKGQQNLTN